MSYVGELIMSIRESAPDLPLQVYPAPAAPASLSGSLTTLGALVASTTYYFKSTVIFPWGETLPSPEATYTTTSGQNTISMSLGGLQPGMIGFRLYAGTAPGQEYTWTFIPVTWANAFPQPPFPITFYGYPLTYGTVPTRNTAYVPDSDGKMLSAARVFGWLTDALGIAGQITGGLPNFTGCSSVTGQPWYEMTGSWKKIDGAWYNGYPVFFGRRTDVFRKNNVQGVSAALIVDMYTDRVRVELWPQPSAAGGTTTLTANIGPTDTSATIASPAGFQTGFGFVLLGSGSGAEIVSVRSFSGAGNMLAGMLRGWGGTRAGTWLSNTPVTELNICLSGLVNPPTYAPGDSALVISLPPGWTSGLHKYLLSRFRDAERRRQEAKALMDEFTATMQNLRTTKQYAGPIQIQANTGRGAEVYPGLGGPFGGVIVP